MGPLFSRGDRLFTCLYSKPALVMYKVSDFRVLLTERIPSIEDTGNKKEKSRTRTKCCEQSACEQLAACCDQLCRMWKQAERPDIVPLLKSMWCLLDSTEITFVPNFEQCGALMVQEILPVARFRAALLSVFDRLTNDSRYARVLVEHQLIEKICKYVESEGEDQAVIISIFANLCAFSCFHEHVFRYVNKLTLILIVQRQGVSRSVVTQAFRLFLNVARHASMNQDLFHGMLETCRSLMSCVPSFCQTMFLATVAFLSDVPDFSVTEEGALLGQYVSDLLTCTEPAVLRMSLHILRNICQQVSLCEDDFQRVVRILMTSQNASVISKACSVIVTVLRMYPERVDEATGRSLCEALRRKVETENFANATECFYCLSWLVTTFPVLVDSIMDNDFMGFLVDQLQVEDMTATSCSIILLNLALTRDKLDKECFNAHGGVPVLESQLQCQNSDISKAAGVLLEYLQNS